MKAVKQTQPVLKYLTEFEKILKEYKPSFDSLQTLQSTKLILLVGPTAAGRNTLIDLLVQTNKYHYIVSDTTRPPRKNNGELEKNGREYWFRSEEEFLDGLRKGKYLEAAVIHHQQVSGISVAELVRARTLDKIAIDEVEVKGTANVHGYKLDTLCVFLLPPSFETWMQRLKSRGQMSEEEMCRRLESAKDEIAYALEQDYYKFVINKEIHEAAKVVDRLANGDTVDQTDQAEARAHAQQLAIDVRLYLNA